jgi:hypothetical protein
MSRKGDCPSCTFNAVAIVSSNTGSPVEFAKPPIRMLSRFVSAIDGGGRIHRQVPAAPRSAIDAATMPQRHSRVCGRAGTEACATSMLVPVDDRSGASTRSRDRRSSSIPDAP